MTAKCFAAINIKKSYEAREYKYNYLHFTLQKVRLRGIHLTVKAGRLHQGTVLSVGQV